MSNFRLVVLVVVVAAVLGVGAGSVASTLLEGPAVARVIIRNLPPPTPPAPEHTPEEIVADTFAHTGEPTMISLGYMGQWDSHANQRFVSRSEIANSQTGGMLLQGQIYIPQAFALSSIQVDWPRNSSGCTPSSVWYVGPAMLRIDRHRFERESDIIQIFDGTLQLDSESSPLIPVAGLMMFIAEVPNHCRIAETTLWLKQNIRLEVRGWTVRNLSRIR